MNMPHWSGTSELRFRDTGRRTRAVEHAITVALLSVAVIAGVLLVAAQLTGH